MAGLPRAASKRSYSWWWDSHIGPKNSKWLQENLTDMDSKVKSMIKLIEEDGDSFARRAEMYYKKRPELMKLVEEFYRAYRALAERYDNATGVLRQAQKTMIEAFPNQDPMGIIDDSIENTASTPDIPPALRALFGPDLQKGSKQLGEGRVKRALNFHNSESLSESEAVSNFEKEIQSLKDALAILETEKVAGQSQYNQSLEKLNKLELEVSRAQNVSREFNDRANKAEREVQDLRSFLTKLEDEKEACLLKYEQCLETINILENDASQAKEEVEELNKRASKAESEKDEAIKQYKHSLEMISNLENKVKLAEEDAKQLRERADNAEEEVETLKQAFAILKEENESNILEYHQCLEKISILEQKLSCSQEEVQRLKGEIDSKATKLKEAEEHCLALEKSNESLNLEVGSLVLKMGSKSEELTEKQKELGNIWSCLEEERFRFVEAETAFQTLQHIYSQTQEQMKSLALEIENKGQLLKDRETHNESLLNEITRINEVNKSLTDCNLSSSMSIKEMQHEISRLVETKGKLADEVELRIDQRNALQQEIYCLREDLNEMNESNQNFKSSVEQLQTENSDLKDISDKERVEKMLLLKKLAIMEHLIEKNVLLAKSLADLTVELEGARTKINALEQSFESLLEEKSTILAEKAAVMSQLQLMIENLEKISENNNFLDNSLSDACHELNELKLRSKTLEESCQSLEKEKTYLINEKDMLVSQGKTTQQAFESLERRQRELEERYSGLEKEQESTFSKVEVLQISLDVEKKERATFAQRTETQLTGMGKQIFLLQDEVFSRRREFEEELDKATEYQLEIFLLRKCVEDLKEKNSSLLAECQKFIEGSKLSEKLISELKSNNLEKQAEVKSLSDQKIMFESKLEDTNTSLHHVLDENQKLNVELSVIFTLLGQLKLDAKSLDMERETLDKELKTKTEELILSQFEANNLLEINEDLNLKVSKLTSLVAGLNMEINELKVVNVNRDSQVNELSDKLNNSHKEFGLMSQLWESEAALMFEELQHSTVFRALLEETFYRLKEEAVSKDAQLELLKKKIVTLEGENGGIEAQLASYGPLFMSLKNSISSLESRTLCKKIPKSHDEGAKEVESVSNENLNADQNILDVNSELKDLQFRIKVIEKAMVQKERENLEANSKLEAAMKTLEDLKFRGSFNREYSVPVSDNSELENEASMKDIILDVNSESSSHELTRQGGRKFQRKMGESWNSADLDHLDKRTKTPPVGMLKRQKSKYRHSEIVAEKELGVDKLEISRTFSQRSQEVSKTKILERLNSDAEKLNNLQIAVQDLMKKTNSIEKGKKGKSVYESDTLRDQLEEAEEAIIELSEYTDKLMRSAEKRSFSSNVKSGLDSEESGSARRRRISEQGRKVSEKIGRLQIEVQKIQFVMMKIDDEKEMESKRSRFTEMRRKVMLRDYLYGVKSPSNQLRRKKSPFCGCIQPPTRGD